MSDSEKQDFDDTYNSKTDDLDYCDLIENGYVLDNKGRMEIKEFSEEEKEKMKTLSVLGIKYAFSGKGFFDGWKSNLQKCVRRCDVMGALKSVYEACDIGGVCLSNIINRLCKVMISEDIGPAYPCMAKECFEFLEYYEKRKELWKINKKTGIIEGSKNLSFDNDIVFKHKLLLITQKIAMCKKSRLCDNAIHAFPTYSIKNREFSEVFDRFKNAVEDIDIEKSIRYIKMLAKFEGNSDKLVLKGECGLVLRFLGRKKHIIYTVWRFILEKSKINKDLLEANCYLLGIFNMAGDEGILNLINAVWNLLLYKEDKLVFDKEICSLNKIRCSWEGLKEKDIWIRDESFDCHTHIGRSLERGKDFFWKYGAKLANKSKLLEEYDRKYYTLCMRNIIKK